jgi:hypothetical protein
MLNSHVQELSLNTPMKFGTKAPFKKLRILKKLSQRSGDQQLDDE